MNISRPEYDQIVLGTRVSDIVARVGEPYAIHTLCPGVQDYEYIERIASPGTLYYENHYFLRVVNGQVISKVIGTENRPAYDLMYQQDPNYASYP